jgi:hypothetical protein
MFDQISYPRLDRRRKPGASNGSLIPWENSHLPIASLLQEDGKERLPAREVPGIEESVAVAIDILVRVLPTREDRDLDSRSTLGLLNQHVDPLTTMTIEDIPVIAELPNRTRERSSYSSQGEQQTKKEHTP